MVGGGDEVELSREVDRMEYAVYLWGLMTEGDAIVALHSGQGGTEAMDWNAMLSRMYQRYFERKGWEFEILDGTMGEEGGDKKYYISSDWGVCVWTSEG